jgi:hypothetical protein
MPPPEGWEDTIIQRPAQRAVPPPAPRRAAAWRLILSVLVLACLGAGGAALFLRPLPEPPAALPQLAAPAPESPSEALPQPLPFAVAVATEAEILANDAPDLVIRRFAGNRAVIVLDFPSLGEQARMLNRVAALVEKSGLPRDRVLDDAELDAAARAGGGSAETFYYGHNYRAADIARFFVLADRDRVRLTAEEERLRALARDLGWLEPGAAGAIISVPRQGAEPWLDASARAAMLRHELSHGEFFTSAAYAEATWLLWRELLTEGERQRLRAALAAASYDPALEEVMANEAQAFLFHTPDERFFNPAAHGFAPARMAELRAAFAAVLPAGWLRDSLTR